MKRLFRSLSVITLACLILVGSIIHTSAIGCKGVNHYVNDISVSIIRTFFGDSAVPCQSGIRGLLCRLNLDPAVCIQIKVPCPKNGSPVSPTEAEPASTEQAVSPSTAPTTLSEPETKPTDATAPAPTHMPTQPAVPRPTAAPTVPATTAPQPTDPPATNEGYTLSAYETEVVRLINEIRAGYGLRTLSINTDLSRVARVKSQDMHDKGYFDHNSPTYGTPFEMMKSFGIRYRYAGENIAMGYRTPQSVVDGWMNSPGHRQNILNGNFTQIGMGYVAAGNYWTQMFIG